MSAEATHHGAGADWQSRAGDYAERGREIATDLGEAIEDQIRARPLGAVLAAAAAGFLMGWLWMRRS